MSFFRVLSVQSSLEVNRDRVITFGLEAFYPHLIFIISNFQIKLLKAIQKLSFLEFNPVFNNFGRLHLFLRKTITLDLQEILFLKNELILLFFNSPFEKSLN